MSKRALVYTVLGLLLMGVIWAFSQLKSSYELLPIQAAKKAAPSTYSLWQNYNAETFSVSVPVLPQNATDVVKEPNTQETRIYDLYVSETPDGTIYMISVITFPHLAPGTAPNALIDSILDGMVKAQPNNVLSENTPASLFGDEGRKFTLQGDEQTFMGQAFMQGKSLFVLTGIYKKDNVQAPDFKYFVDSFALKP